MKNTPGHRFAVGSLAAAVLLLAGCENMSERQKGTAVGAGIGAVAGAVLSSATGGKAGTGAVVGGAVGAVAGNLWSKRMEDKRKAMEQATQGTGIDVARTNNNELKVNVPSDFSFDVGRAAVKPAMRPVRSQYEDFMRHVHTCTASPNPTAPAPARAACSATRCAST